MDTLNNELIPEQSWWKRNWKWALPTGGCLTLIVIVVVAIGIGAFGLVEKIKENTDYDGVIAMAQTNEQLIEELGTPIEQDGIGSYKISFKNGNRTSNAVIPIKGPKGKGAIHITTSGKKDPIIYEQLDVYLENKDITIDLLPLMEKSKLESM